MKNKWTINKLLKKFYIKFIMGTCHSICIGCPYKYDCYYECFIDFPTWKELREAKRKGKRLY